MSTCRGGCTLLDCCQRRDAGNSSSKWAEATTHTIGEDKGLGSAGAAQAYPIVGQRAEVGLHHDLLRPCVIFDQVATESVAIGFCEGEVAAIGDVEVAGGGRAVAEEGGIVVGAACSSGKAVRGVGMQWGMLPHRDHCYGRDRQRPATHMTARARMAERAGLAAAVEAMVVGGTRTGSLGTRRLLGMRCCMSARSKPYTCRQLWARCTVRGWIAGSNLWPSPCRS